jgi:hypothetical protein
MYSLFVPGAPWSRTCVHSSGLDFVLVPCVSLLCTLHIDSKLAGRDPDTLVSDSIHTCPSIHYVIQHIWMTGRGTRAKINTCMVEFVLRETTVVSVSHVLHVGTMLDDM